MEYQGQEITALIDTGATHAFIRRELVDDVENLMERAVRLANGEQVMAYGPKKINITIGNMETSAEVFVMRDMFEEMILGVQWLREQEATIEIKNGGLYFGRVQRQVSYWRPITRQRIESAPVKLTEQNTLPGEIPFYKEILNEYAEVFGEEMSQPTTNLVKHQIRLRDTKPFKFRRYMGSKLSRRERNL